jgi:DNA mismatch endonuclease, patch repair protein
LELPLVDRITKEKRSKIMSAIHSKNTKPEIALRKVLWARGFRFRVQYGKEKIDIAFPSKNIAVFVDGCFWHGCPIHSHIPKSNEEYWLPKLKKNVVRDRQKNERLMAEGWAILRFWEHELPENDKIISIIKAKLRQKSVSR